ncbi:hypothetical protein [Methylocystis heyeri]|nr:hypothetical protein [Methylocystis heyeri]
MRILIALSICIVGALYDAYACGGRHNDALWREAQAVFYDVAP